MRIEIDGNTMRIKGKNVGETRHIKIYFNEDGTKDIFNFSIIKDGIEHSCLPTIEMDRDYVIKDGEVYR